MRIITVGHLHLLTPTQPASRPRPYPLRLIIVIAEAPPPVRGNVTPPVPAHRGGGEALIYGPAPLPPGAARFPAAARRDLCRRVRGQIRPPRPPVRLRGNRKLGESPQRAARLAVVLCPRPLH
ncbi:hypothetical protein AAFF_G00206590 [Aldrovandia affinis]|uniref:Uncharacterized protein n=1 Tax=Aldrovandia affinis TaxID=143900 RepID=A0AAD7RHQ0_9TELE|nr:hypothetical protein AAFF_G00206590 [Aldrovandia affinis]